MGKMEKARKPASAPRPALILVVEDNPITRKTVRLALQAEGHRVAEAEDGRSALAQWQQETPDLVLLDLLLPDMHGAEVLKQLRALPDGADVPVLAFSGFITKMEESRAAGAGFTDFLLKPVEPSRLARTVAGYLAPRAARAPVPIKRHRLLLVDDDPVLLKLLRLQFEHIGFKVDVAHDGAEALTLAQHAASDVIVTDVLMPHMDGFELCLAVRQDPRLRQVPVVMISANYVEDADRRLGERVGASAFIYREQGFDAIHQAVQASLQQPVPDTTASTHEIEVERHAQIMRQLERQMTLHAACAQRNVVQSAILHELSLISDALAQHKDLETMLNEILAYCLDGVGLSKGVLYLVENDGQLALHAQYGCQDVLQPAGAFFGVPALFHKALRARETVMVPSVDIVRTDAETLLRRTQAKSALIIPVRAGEQDVAVLLLLSLHRDLLEQDWLAFGRVLAAQIGQSVTLSRTFYRLSESERHYRMLFESANDGICVIDDDGRVVDANPAACALAGRVLEEFRGTVLGELMIPKDAERWPTVLGEYVRKGEMQDEITYNLKAGTVKTVEVSGVCIAPGRNLIMARDITERKRTEATIERLAYRDALTDLPNRTALQERLRQALAEAKDKQQPLALLFLDLNNFRDINDTLGHLNGDRVLTQVAARLKEVLWESDMVARLAADEFAVLLPRLANRRDIALVTRKLTEAFRTPFTVADVPLDVQLSIGVALYPEHGGSVDELFQRADVALHAAKANHQPHSIYDAAFDHHDPKQLRLMAELRAAIAQEALTLYYQPKWDLATGAVAGVEALVRWPHPAHGLLLPGEFIPLAEKTGLIDDLTRWVIKAALYQAQQWRSAGFTVEIAANISARNLLDSDFVAQTIDLFTQSGSDPKQLVFEITESAIMSDPEGARKKLNALHKFGVQFAIDDFGTGYSSLSYLMQLPVSHLKIDQSFVAHMAEPGSASIVRSTIDLAHNLNLRVVAEGVEQQWQADRLREMGCDIGQGYYFSRPIPAEELLPWLRQHAALSA